MSALERQGRINMLEREYKLLTERGVTRPDSRGRKILTRSALIDLLSNPPKKTLHDFFDWTTSTYLKTALANKDVQFTEYLSIVNQHMNLAKLVLDHNKEMFPKDYEQIIDFFDERRGGYLKQIAEHEKSAPENWTEYAYWLLCRTEKFKLTVPEKSEELKREARNMLHKAHDAGYTEATEALATFLYSETGQGSKAIKLWEIAAADGNEMALKHLFDALCADDSLKIREIKVSLAKADEQALRKLFNALKSKPDLTPHDAECAMFVSEAITLKSKTEEATRQDMAGTSHSPGSSAGTPPVPV